jgi:hypothetical protein
MADGYPTSPLCRATGHNDVSIVDPFDAADAASPKFVELPWIAKDRVLAGIHRLYVPKTSSELIM